MLDKAVNENTSAVEFEKILGKLQELTKSDDKAHRKADPYWTRVLAQTTRFEQHDNLLKLLQQTKAWFGELFPKEEKKSTKKAAN